MKSTVSAMGSRAARRKGASLAELLVVMSAASVILTMSAVLTHRIMHAQSKARAIADVERTSLRLASTFRSDIHQATAATTNDLSPGAGVFLRLELSESQRIEYRRDAAGILRLELNGEAIISRDAFDFPVEAELSVQKDGSRLVVLTIKSRPGEMLASDGRSEASAFALPVNLHVEAALHRDSLFPTAPVSVGGLP